MYVKIGGVWQLAQSIDAPNHREAFRRAMMALDPRHYDKQIRLEQEEQKHSSQQKAPPELPEPV